MGTRKEIEPYSLKNTGLQRTFARYIWRTALYDCFGKHVDQQNDFKATISCQDPKPLATLTSSFCTVELKEKILPVHFSIFVANPEVSSGVHMSLTNFLIPTYMQMLRTILGLLDKAQNQLPQEEADALLSKSLAPDMYPLSSQIRFACFQAQESTFRLRGEPVPETLQQIAREARNAGERPGSLADARSCLRQALSFLEALEPGVLDAGEERPITLELPNGAIFDMTGAQYARDWALSQFYFHVTMAYAILRNQKIEIGKADYVPHMFAYLRPGSVPEN